MKFNYKYLRIFQREGVLSFSLLCSATCLTFFTMHFSKPRYIFALATVARVAVAQDAGSAPEDLMDVSAVFTVEEDTVYDTVTELGSDAAYTDVLGQLTDIPLQDGFGTEIETPTALVNGTYGEPAAMLTPMVLPMSTASIQMIWSAARNDTASAVTTSSTLPAGWTIVENKTIYVTESCFSSAGKTVTKTYTYSKCETTATPTFSRNVTLATVTSVATSPSYTPQTNVTYATPVVWHNSTAAARNSTATATPTSCLGTVVTTSVLPPVTVTTTRCPRAPIAPCSTVTYLSTPPPVVVTVSAPTPSIAAGPRPAAPSVEPVPSLEPVFSLAPPQYTELPYSEQPAYGQPSYAAPAPTASASAVASASAFASASAPPAVPTKSAGLIQNSGGARLVGAAPALRGGLVIAVCAVLVL